VYSNSNQSPAVGGGPASDSWPARQLRSPVQSRSSRPGRIALFIPSDRPRVPAVGFPVPLPRIAISPPAPGLVLSLIFLSLISDHLPPSPASRTTVSLYARDVVVRRSQPGRPRRGSSRRAPVSGLAPEAARRLRFTARNLVGLTTLLTLTYPGSFPADGALV
jgi:hypothetical protein